MDKYESLNHTAWDCKYHVVFIPKWALLHNPKPDEPEPNRGVASRSGGSH